MNKIVHSIILRAPLEEVFEYVSDWEKWEEWFEGVSNFEPTTITQKGNGTRYKYKAKLMGFKATLETEIHDFIENEGWRGQVIKGMPHETYWNFEELNGNTKFTYGLQYSLSIPIIGTSLDSLLLKPQWNRIIKNSLQNLANKFNQ
jgi:carbon monoxide dehydrogenase subunit G